MFSKKSTGIALPLILTALFAVTPVRADNFKSTQVRQFLRTVHFDDLLLRMHRLPCNRNTVVVNGAYSVTCIAAVHRYCQMVATMQNVPMDIANTLGTIQEVNPNGAGGIGLMDVICTIPELP